MTVLKGQFDGSWKSYRDSFNSNVPADQFKGGGNSSQEGRLGTPLRALCEFGGAGEEGGGGAGAKRPPLGRVLGGPWRRTPCQVRSSDPA